MGDGLSHPWFAFERAMPVVVAVGRLRKQKDFETLLRAFARVLQTRPAHLVILGEGEERDNMQALAETLGIAVDVELAGFAANPLPYFRDVDLFVLSARYEGLPTVLIEALACSTPFVSTDCPSGPREIIKIAGSGDLVRVVDVEALARAIEQQLAKGKSRDFAGADGVHRALRGRPIPRRDDRRGMMLGIRFQQLPRPVRMRINIHRARPLWHQAGMIFIHVPKNGGTSVNNALYGRFMGHFTVDDIELFHRSLFASLPSLALTRNPWARVYSAYRFARKGAEMTDGARVKDPQKYQVKVFSTFESFVHDWLDGRDLTNEDLIFRQQSDFILRRGGAIGVTRLGRLEEPESYLGWVEEVTGKPLNIPHLNRTSGATDYRAVYSSETRDLVARAYAQDVECFGYDF